MLAKGVTNSDTPFGSVAMEYMKASAAEAGSPISVTDVSNVMTSMSLAI